MLEPRVRDQPPDWARVGAAFPRRRPSGLGGSLTRAPGSCWARFGGDVVAASGGAPGASNVESEEAADVAGGDMHGLAVGVDDQRGHAASGTDEAAGVAQAAIREGCAAGAAGGPERAVDVGIPNEGER